MKKFFSRTLKIGKFTITFFSNEVVVVYLGKTRVFVKTFYFGLRSLLRKTAYILLPACVVFMLLGTVITQVQMDDEFQKDEEAKNSLLSSATTDYQNPEESTPLEIRTHVVKRGQTLSEIAKEYGVSIDTVCGSNNLRSYDLIHEGVRLRIPNKDGMLHTFQKDNRLTDLSLKYKIPLEKILDHNDLVNQDFIPVGTVVFIPDARPQNIFPGFLWPVASRYITCGYGWRRNPFGGGGREFHQGLDIRASYENVRASRFGRVTYAGWLGGYGYAVVVAHPGGWKTLYAHLSRMYVRPGQYVKQGQNIARSGNTGRSTGAHLHFEIQKNGKPQNPYRLLGKQ
jgi:murein DD-endopeptidase MepM/ murein hydrolase activator NlpD